MVETRWYYAVGQAPSGPLTAGELRDRVASGQLSPDTLVCQENGLAWVPAWQAGFGPSPADFSDQEPPATGDIAASF